MTHPTPVSFRIAMRRTAGIVLAASAAIGLAACAPASNASESSDTRTYENEYGTVELPEQIDRIVSVDFYTPAALLDLGVTPVGVVNTYFTDTDGVAIPQEYTRAIADSDAQSIGEYYEINLEAVAEADPDLIVATSDFLTMDDPLRAELEKVAPIVTFPARDGESWRTRATEMAKILDKEDELAPLDEAYNERRDEIIAKYGDLLTDRAYTVLVPQADEWGTYADTHFATPILRDLGVTFREQQDDEVNEALFPEWFSYESIDRLSNADVIFILQSDDEIKQNLAKNTIYAGLPAVQNGLVFDYIPLSPTGSFGWASDNLEDLDALFAEVQQRVDAQA
ncbi:ABC transporter substrate-binding protein [Leucobacter japonicus]|uniref:ABC transporter substrate-binding protein n=1 Tax=Leucobacter japonicus TaxID=1461259 RepID=UPI0006A78BB7|nr:ABC transporter substrate-binding protein [Leucobacter japonicus]